MSTTARGASSVGGAVFSDCVQLPGGCAAVVLRSRRTEGGSRAARPRRRPTPKARMGYTVASRELSPSRRPRCYPTIDKSGQPARPRLRLDGGRAGR
jgi:hypothetical protein